MNRLALFLLLCLPAAAQPEAAFKLWKNLQGVDAAQAAPLLSADPAAAHLLYQELYFEAADCKLFDNAPFSARAEVVRRWLAPQEAEAPALEAILLQKECDYSGQSSGVGGLINLYQQCAKKPELKPQALAEAEKLQVELAQASLLLESDAAGAARAEAIWKRWGHPLGLMLCDVLRGQAADSKEQWSEAIGFYTRAAETGLTVPGWRVSCLERIGYLYTNKLGQPARAATALQHAIETQAQRPSNAERLKKLGSLETLRGAALAQEGQHAQASQAYARGEEARNRAYALEKAELEEGLVLASKASNPEAVFVASDTYLYLLDSLASERNDWETQGKVAQRRLDMARAKQDWSATAQALEAQARALVVSRPLKARALALEAYDIRQQKLAGKSLQRSAALLADIAYQQNEWSECLQRRQEVIALAEPGASPPLYELDHSPPDLRAIHKKSNLTERQSQLQTAFLARMGMGQVEHILGNYRQAGQTYDELTRDLPLLLLAGLEDEAERRKSYTPTTWNQLYEELKKNGADQERIDQGRLVASGLEAVLTTLRARLLSDQGDLDGASQAYKLGIERTTQLLGGSFPLVGAYLSLAGLEMDRGHYNLAEGPLQTALDQYVRRHDSAGTAGTLGQMSALRRRQNKPLEAVQLARQGLELAETLGEPVQQANLSRALGLAEAELGGSALNDSEKHLRQAAQVYRRLGLRSGLAYALSGLGQTLERLRRDQEALATYREAVALVELLATEISPSDLQLFNTSRANAELYDRLIRLLLKLGKSDESFRYLERFKAKALMDALAGLRIHSNDPRIQALLSSVQSLADQLRKAEAELSRGSGDEAAKREVEARYREAIRLLQKADPNYAGLVSVGPATDLAGLRQRLPKDTLLLEYYPTDDKLFIFALSAGQEARVFSAPVGRKELLQKVSQLRAAIKDRAELAGLSRELYATLIAPAQAAVDEARCLVVVPGGELYQLPFQALMNSQGHYLVESKTVAYLAQADMLPTVAPQPAPKKPRLLALGNPDLSLPAASLEAREIGRLFAGSEVFVESRATLAQLISLRHSPVYLHLATHGIFNGLDPKESSLVLAGQPGQLRVRDLLEGQVKLRLVNNRLVTLSACQTHMGGNDPGALYGSLSRAFSKVGAPAVVATLWSVEDESTRQLMANFYAELARGQQRGLALSLAQRKLLARPEFSHPYFWAPFVLLGEWR